MRAFALSSLLLLLGATPWAAAAAEQEKDKEASATEGVHTGFVPAFRAGSNRFDRVDATGKSTSFSGLFVAFDMTYHWILPGDRFAFGACGGLFFANGKDEARAPGHYYGLNLGPVVEVGIIPRLYLHARFERIMAEDLDELAVAGWRYGGGATVVAWRTEGADAALQLDVLKTSASTKFAEGKRDLDALSFIVGLQFAVDPLLY